MPENGIVICTCKKTKCVRHGKCAECIEYHKNNPRYALPQCKRKGKKDAGEMIPENSGPPEV